MIRTQNIDLTCKQNQMKQNQKLSILRIGGEVVGVCLVICPYLKGGEITGRQ